MKHRIYCCNRCKYLFEAAFLVDQCPDCGWRSIRNANESERVEYAGYRAEFGPAEPIGIYCITGRALHTRSVRC